VIPPKNEKVGVPPPPRYFFPRIFSGKKSRDYRKIKSLGAFHLIMNPTVNKRKLRREEEKEKKVDEILKEVDKEFRFLKHLSLDEFAQQLKRKERIEPLWEITIYPKFTCNWFIEGLDFCTPGWRHEFERPITPPPLPPRKWKKN